MPLNTECLAIFLYFSSALWQYSLSYVNLAKEKHVSLLIPYFNLKPNSQYSLKWSHEVLDLASLNLQTLYLTFCCFL